MPEPSARVSTRKAAFLTGLVGELEKRQYHRFRRSSYTRAPGVLRYMSTGSSVWPRTFCSGNYVASFFDFAVRSHWRAAAMLLIASLIALLPGFFQMPPVDRDEARFAQATKQMIETGDYVDIRFQNDVRYKKPIGIYWLQATVVKTAETLGFPHARTTIWLYRVPSLFGAIGAVLLTYTCALAFVSRRAAMLAALMMVGSPLFGFEARLATTDAVLLVAVIAAMGVLARVYLSPRDGISAQSGLALPAVFWTALAMGVELKGPVIVMIVALAAATLSIIDRSARWLTALRPFPGFAWLIVLVFPWFAAIYWRAGNAFFVDSIYHDMLAKVVTGKESHGGPPGLYTVLFFATFFPASVLAVLAAPSVWVARHKPTTCFLLAWLLPSWIVFELIPTKLPNYVLPLFPAIAILVAGAVESKVLSHRPWLKRGVIWWFVVPITATIALIAGAFAIDRHLMLPAWPFFAAAIVCGLMAWKCYNNDGAATALMRAIAAVILIMIGTFSYIVPALGPLFPSVALARVLQEAGCQSPGAASVGYEEPSLVFLAGTPTLFTDASGAVDFLHEADCRFAFIDVLQEPAFLLRAKAIRLRYDRGPRIEAFNFTKGQRITIDVFRSVGGAP